jgi:hypothetical protein
MIKDVVNDHTVLVVHIEPESVYLFKRIYLWSNAKQMD